MCLCVCVLEREIDRERLPYSIIIHTLLLLTMSVPLLPELRPETKTFLFLSGLQLALSQPLEVIKKSINTQQKSCFVLSFVFSLFMSFTQVMPWGQEVLEAMNNEIFNVGCEKYETRLGLSCVVCRDSSVK